jgi:hypothetical protein
MERFPWRAAPADPIVNRESPSRTANGLNAAGRAARNDARHPAPVTWFVIEPDHDLPQIERVISQDDGYRVVEKLILEEYMEETDRRSKT